MFSVYYMMIKDACPRLVRLCTSLVSLSPEDGFKPQGGSGPDACTGSAGIPLVQQKATGILLHCLPPGGNVQGRLGLHDNPGTF